MAPLALELSASSGHTEAFCISTPKGTKMVGCNLVLRCCATKLFYQHSPYLCSREKRSASSLWTLHSERIAESAIIAAHVILSYPPAYIHTHIHTYTVYIHTYTVYTHTYIYSVHTYIHIQCTYIHTCLLTTLCHTFIYRSLYERAPTHMGHFVPTRSKLSPLSSSNRLVRLGNYRVSHTYPAPFQE